MNRLIQNFLVICCALVLVSLQANLGAQTPGAQSVDPSLGQAAALRARIRGPIVDADRVVVEGNVHPLARPGNDQGVVADEMRMDRMVLVLQPSAAQQAELDALTAAQQDPESPLYHQWLTPEEYGGRFGVSASDLAQITQWLQGHGFAVEPAPAGRNLIVFSGDAGQVAETFHAEMHRYAVHGTSHLANAQNPEIPRAMASVVAGVLSLHDFRRASGTHRIAAVARPENTQGSTHYLFPADYATIYNLNPQYSAGNNGTGISIAIVGRSNINLSDVSSFRSGSGLPVNQPTVILEGANPGLISGDQDESTLDVEWSGATAPGAAVKFVVGASTAATDGVDLSAQYIVNHKTANIVSTSYGSCEAYMGASELAFYNNLWQQAASEGISSFVSSGDSGAAGCDPGAATTGTQQGVNGLCSSPYSTCVGGTEFNEGSAVASYWSSTNGANGGSALSYIPEKVWNESASDGGSGLWASTGGVSITYTQPAWQQGIAGASSHGMRAVPDVALTAASHDGYLIDENGSWYIIAGTSAASPSFAGIMAVVEQKLAGAAQGNANPILYSLVGASQNPFHATPAGNNSVPGVTGFSATGVTYNLATGLGSVDANVLANVWPAGGVVQKGFTLKASAASESLLPGKSATFTVSTAATGGFTGAISFKATAPAGVIVTFNPASVNVGGSTTASITVSSTAAAATGSITITGTSGTTTATATVPLTIAAKPTLALALGASKVQVARGAAGTVQVTTTIGGTFTGAVSLSVTGLPTGVSASWTSGSFTPTADGNFSSTLTLRPATTAALSTSALQIVATGDGLTAQTPLSLQVTAAPAVTLTLSPASLSMPSMSTQSVTITVSPVGGVSLASSAATAVFKVTGLPGGITGTWGTPTLTTAGTLQAKLTLTGSTSAVSTSTQPNISATVADSSTGKSYSGSNALVLTVTRVLPTITIAPAAARVTLVQGQSGTVQFTTTVGGSYAGATTLAVSGLPAGVTATWTNGAFTRTDAGSTGSTLTIKAAATAAVATTPLHITATGDGVVAQTTVSVQVTPAPAVTLTLAPASASMQSMASASFTATVSPIGGVSLTSSVAGAVFTVSGLPGGITGSWAPATLTTAGTLQAKLTLTGSTSAVTSTTQPKISATVADSASGKSYTASATAALGVTRVQPTLAMTASAPKVSLTPGQTGSVQFTTTTGGSFNGTVALTLSGLPSGVTATWTNGSFVKNGSTSTQSTLTLKAAATTPLSTTTLHITATGAGLSALSSVAVQVTTTPAVSLSVFPAQLTVQPNATNQLAVTLTPEGGARLTPGTADFAFTVQGLPVGVTASWGAASITADGLAQAPLTLSSGNAQVGNTSVMVSGSARDAATGQRYTFQQQINLAALRPVTENRSRTSIPGIVLGK